VPSESSSFSFSCCSVHQRPARLNRFPLARSIEETFLAIRSKSSTDEGGDSGDDEVGDRKASRGVDREELAESASATGELAAAEADGVPGSARSTLRLFSCSFNRIRRSASDSNVCDGDGSRCCADESPLSTSSDENAQWCGDDDPSGDIMRIRFGDGELIMDRNRISLPVATRHRRCGDTVRDKEEADNAATSSLPAADSPATSLADSSPADSGIDDEARMVGESANLTAFAFECDEAAAVGSFKAGAPAGGCGTEGGGGGGGGTGPYT